MSDSLTSNTKELLSKSELSIWIDTYDDVFSDFDPRPFTERSLSDDFLNEVKKMVREKPSGTIDLKLLIPKNLRHKETEAIIIKHLHTHFHHQALQCKADITKTVRRGFLLTIFGVVLMVIAAYIVSLSEKFYLNVIKIIAEPAGWFMVWTGLDNIISGSKQRTQNLSFANKMAHSSITFLSY